MSASFGGSDFLSDAAGGLFLAVRLVVLPHALLDKKALYSCASSRRAASSSRAGAEARQLPQTRKDKFGWPFHALVYGRFLMPRCDVKHTTTRPVRSVVIGERGIGGCIQVRAATHHEAL